MDKNKKIDYDVAELITHQKRKLVNYSVESSNIKPYDLSLMTGNSQSNKKEGEQK